MWYEFPLDEESWSDASEDQYMFGPEYLVAPVLVPAVKTRSVFLPKLGANEVWTHFYSKIAYEGGQRLSIDVTLSDFPLFQRTRKSLPLDSTTLIVEEAR